MLAGDRRANNGRDGRACWSRRCPGDYLRRPYGGAGDRGAPSAGLPSVGGDGVFVSSVVPGDGVVCAGRQAGAQDVRLDAPSKLTLAEAAERWLSKAKAGVVRSARGTVTNLRRFAATSRRCAPGSCPGLARSDCRRCRARCCRGSSMSWSARVAHRRLFAMRCCRCGRSIGARCSAMSWPATRRSSWRCRLCARARETLFGCRLSMQAAWPA